MAPVSATSDTVTGKSLSEALILPSINPKYDDRLSNYNFSKVQVLCMLVSQIVLNEKRKRQLMYTTCAELVVF